MASITIKEMPAELHGQLKREAEANFRSLNQEVLARIERTFEIDAALHTKRDQRWIEEALASGPATPLTEKEMEAIRKRILKGKGGVMQVLKRPQFLFDWAEELTWLADKAGPDVAERWCQSLKDTIRLLEQHPFLGRERKDLAPPGIRSWRVSDFPRWLIFYSVDQDNRLVLYRIRQGTMNLVVLKLES